MPRLFQKRKSGTYGFHSRKSGSARGGAEIAFAQADKASVDAIFTDWKDLGVEILQTPVDMDFGYTFTVADADGHRLRVFALADAPR